MALPQYGSHRQGMRVMDHTSAPHGWTNVASIGNEEEDLSKHEPTDAERARTILGNSRTATLSASVGENTQAPIAFAVTCAVDKNGYPLIALRDGIESALRVQAGSHVCLVATEIPLTANHSGCTGGVSVLGTLRAFMNQQELEAANSVFGGTQPSESSAVKRGASNLYQLEINVLLLSGGNGDVVRVDLRDYKAASSDPLAAVAPGLASHLTGDENGSLVLLCRAFGNIHATTSADLVGIDRFGMDLRANTPDGPRTVRIAFGHSVSSADEVRRELVAMTRGARFKLGVG